ncbi:cysteine--tRNA ligase [Pseudotabrizicola sediminis]|uniref:Cysteine--tRNA ligase n=1 Tax=Pseudotabrizicola sediminis TaxID=2486418 RepID=A0ABY2KQW6_9RHOB|nr:cysteine--tRNA ligase [Pseudotabrizicola sediminis]TGD45176.1 cysteine--tRNA ligase [Pseudotabrizicola sediminis]
MVTIRLTNSMTHRKEAFVPLDAGNVRMYVCGPTVYDRAHLGNARPVVVFDVLYRLLRHVYGAEHVTYVRNFTDVDDKINAEALRRQQAGAAGTLEDLIRQRTEETIDWYHADMDALGALRPSIRGEVTDRAAPRATEFIGAMVAMIEGLVAKGHAYAREGHVLFRVRSYADYGALSGRSVDDMIAGARVEVAPFKEDPMDFVLWKPSSGQEPGWDGPVVDGRVVSRGRPGWHIECSAMSHELLGESFDIHGGGLDLQFPHHENEIAQSACAHEHGAFARYWLHNEMLQVEGKKMSKSLGNFFTVRDLLEQGVPGEVIRFVLLSTHYRSPMDWTKEKADDALEILKKWRLATNDIAPAVVDDEAITSLCLDLDTAGVIARLHKLYDQEKFAELKATGQQIGILTDELRWVGKFELNARVSMALGRLWELYQTAKSEKNFETIDAIKNELGKKAIKLRFERDHVRIESIGMFELFSAVRSLSAEEKAKIFGDAFLRTDTGTSMQHEAMSYAYVSSAIERILNELAVSGYNFEDKT